MKNICFLKKIIGIYLLYLFIFANNLSAGNLSNAPIFLKDEIYSNDTYCGDDKNIVGYNEFLTVKSISIQFNKNRKWISNLLDAIVSSEEKNSSSLIDKRYKKKFASKVSVEFEGGIICDFTAKIRIHGDLDDHILFESRGAISSMDIVLQNGSINSIIGFKLFLPPTREGDNEIIATTLLSNLGFLSPKTFYVPVKLNGFDMNFIFQEKIRKEMLESNQLRESAIYEGDERWSFLDWDTFEKLNPHPSLMELARMSNGKWSTKGNIHQDISIEGLKIINQIYLRQTNSLLFSHQLDMVDFEYSLVPNFDNHIRERHEAFEALQFALSAEHGLSTDESRYYFDPFYKDFIPIYYDGEVRILREKEVPITAVTTNSKNGIILSLKILDNLDKKKFQEDLEINGVNLLMDEVNVLIKKIRERISSLNQISPIKVLDYNPDVDRNLFYNNFQSNTKIVFDNNMVLPKIVSLNNKNDKLNFLVCNNDLTDCANKMFDNNEVKQLLEQEYKDKDENNYIFLGMNLDNYKNGFNKNNDCMAGICKWKNIHLNNSSMIRISKDISYNINDEIKLIEINQLSPDGKVVFYSGSISDWTIIFSGHPSIGSSENSRLDSDGLTGCLTFMDIDINNVLIKTISAPCEDSVNFIRANGKEISIDINHSKSDALDADFSNLDFNFVDIMNSDNDCLDFSGGKYQIALVNLDSCKDKAISIGENSIVDLKQGKIKNSKIGIATKDSSSAFVNELDIENVDLCLAVYRKKQEFTGALININQYKCKNYKHENYISRDSQLSIKNEL